MEAPATTARGAADTRAQVLRTGAGLISVLLLVVRRQDAERARRLRVGPPVSARSERSVGRALAASPLAGTDVHAGAHSPGSSALRTSSPTFMSSRAHPGGRSRSSSRRRRAPASRCELRSCGRGSGSSRRSSRSVSCASTPVPGAVPAGQPVTLSGMARDVGDTMLEQRPAGGVWKPVEEGGRAG